MNQFEYLFRHCIPTGWRSIASAFRIWRDLMTDNFTNYAILDSDDPFEECHDWFWFSLGEDDVMPKEFLEYLIELVRELDEGKAELIPLSEEFIDSLKRSIEADDDGDV